MAGDFFHLRPPFTTTPALAEGVNVYQGEITYRAVAESQGRKYMPLEALV